MMRNRIVKAAAITAGMVAVSFGVVPNPAGADPSPRGGCAQAGLETLRDLGLFQDAAKKKIDYSTLADEEAGPIFADLPEGSFLSLGQVVKLHTQSPELFAWCR